MNNKKHAPIGIFDSGIGGLTVTKAVIKALPNEDIIYFGDTARVPYGSKSIKTIRNYALEITDFMLSKGVKLILIACNSVSASAKNEIITRAGSIPVLDVISAGTQAVFESDEHTLVGVIGTLATINSKAYEKAIHQKDENVIVIQQACPLLVPLAEEGWLDNEVAHQTLKVYLKPFSQTRINSLILGCTHYPLFKEQIAQTLGIPSIRIIDSADSIAQLATKKLASLKLLNSSGGNFECFVSDRPQRFQEVAERFLGQSISDVHVIEL